MLKMSICFSSEKCLHASFLIPVCKRTVTSASCGPMALLSCPCLEHKDEDMKVKKDVAPYLCGGVMVSY